MIIWLTNTLKLFLLLTFPENITLIIVFIHPQSVFVLWRPAADSALFIYITSWNLMMQTGGSAGIGCLQSIMP